MIRVALSGLFFGPTRLAVASGIAPIVAQSNA